ncbi:bifunctional metallophosphatase/5'-nucleotidase [Herbiconiux sp. SYSU D00978]|uniref:bifunctional metallophosphatase/5'-nucleotidase n=1 Tax=Herbiconiux sp. SYSU D00978 TaxID=2812562 RepID=UPI001A97AB42|nr:5'-nucleotidase C-terminal domain-containing protein [Herbiconiux sp. SYSU D00978]
MHVSRTLGVAALAALGLTLAAPTAATAAPGDSVELTLMATTDTHGHVYDWDYFQNAPYPAASALGLSRVGAVVDAVRAEKGEEAVITVDNGDAIQGTPLTYYYGFGDGRQSVLDGTVEHPMAQAFDAIGYDAQVVGNHEYNYGLDMLEAYAGDLEAPLLGANVIDVATGKPYHEPYEILERVIDGKTVQVGVLGLVTPGVRIWDKQYVEGKLEFQDMVEAAERWVPEVATRADVVVVLAHTGQGTVPDTEYDPTDLNEDVANNIATKVPGIDVLVAGHSHQDKPSTVLTNAAGEKVLITQPNYWARSVSEVTMTLVEDAAGDFDVDWTNAPPAVKPHYGTESAAQSQKVLDALADEHRTTVDYVNTPVADSVQELPATASRYEDTAIIDFINHVQAETVEQGLEGTEYADLPVVSQASPFSRTAVFPEGEVTIRDIAGLYIYENTLRGVVMTGAQLKEYLEFSARYFAQVEEGAAFDPATGTNAVYPDRPQGVPDYNYDALSGLDYTIDISQPVGSRIVGLSHPEGTPVEDGEEFVLAVNNYRQSGGGGFPSVAQAPLVYDELQEIRQLLIDWASARGVIDPADFFEPNWSLVTGGEEDPVPTPGEGNGAPAEPGAEPSAPEGTPIATPIDTGDVATETAAERERRLANTGADVSAVPIVVAAVLMLLGLVGVVVARRRRTSH